MVVEPRFLLKSIAERVQQINVKSNPHLMDLPARSERSDDRKYVCCSQANLNGHLVITDSSPFVPHPNSFSRFNPLYTGSPFIIRTRCGLLSVLNKLGLNEVHCLCLKKMLEFLPGCLKEKKTGKRESKRDYDEFSEILFRKQLYSRSCFTQLSL